MGMSLQEVAEDLREFNGKHVKLVYAFNGVGKTRLSKEFVELVRDDETELLRGKILYYNAFTEDLFYWDNDFSGNQDFKLKIQPNSFVRWIIKDQGQDSNIISNFQRYVDDKLTPTFDLENNQITFTFQRGNEELRKPVKISRGEENIFVWSTFYTLLELVINERGIEPENRSVRDFDNLEYVFIDDPVSSLDENHLIELASNLAGLIKESNGRGLAQLTKSSLVIIGNISESVRLTRFFVV